MPYYAVAVGKNPGVYKTWEECQNQTKGYPQAKYRKFNTETEASNFVKTAGTYLNNSSIKINANITTAVNIENLNPPELVAVASQPSHTLLKHDRLGLIAEKLDKFIEQTNKKLSEFSSRLDILETSLYNRCTPERKRKNTTEEDKTRSKSKKKKLHVTVELSDGESSDTPVPTTTRSQSTTETVEQVDSPWRGNNSTPQGFIVDQEGFTIVYTDGACSNNGRTGAKAGVGVWFNHNHPLVRALTLGFKEYVNWLCVSQSTSTDPRCQRVRELVVDFTEYEHWFNVAGPVEGTPTNNNAEIQAATRAIQQARLAGVRRLNIHTDSQFMISCITEWIKKWKRNNWMTTNGGQVKNKEQLIILDEAIKTLDAVKWTHVRGHTGHEGNECADALARSGATMY
ncbi:Ribonuclease H1 [Homalodisca vitripennis]|nr:Ribonuclease H1 [Homalodisca vitripennis]